MPRSLKFASLLTFVVILLSLKLLPLKLLLIPLLLESFLVGKDVLRTSFVQPSLRAFYLKIPKPLSGIAWIGLALIQFVFATREFGTSIGYEPASAVLLVLSVAKLFEWQNENGRVFLAVSNIFVCACILIDLPDLSIFLFSLVVGVLHILVLMPEFGWRYFKPTTQIRSIALLMIYAIPFVFLMFFVFPRFTSPLSRWIPRSTAQTGFSEEVEPGSVSKLALSEDIAFRIFSDDMEVILKTPMYWRVLTLDRSEGLSWKKSVTAGRLQKFETVVAAGEILKAEVILEPKTTRWLVGLDTPIRFSGVKGLDTSLRSSVKVEAAWAREPLDRRSYYFESSTSRFLESHSKDAASWMQVPFEAPERLFNLLVNLKTRDRDETVRNVLAWIQKSNFHYTLEPSRTLKKSEVAEFLLDVKEGFCEHYAGSMASLLRWLNVPSRVVIGFRGGEYNPYGNYLVVRKKHAHAWVEFLSTSGVWLRFDPVNLLASYDTLLGLAENRETFGLTESALSSLSHLRRALLWVDAAENKIMMFLLAFDQEDQESLWQNLGVKGKQNIIMFSVLILLLAILVWLLFLRSRQNRANWLESFHKSFGDFLERAETNFNLKDQDVLHDNVSLESRIKRLSRLFEQNDENTQISSKVEGAQALLKEYVLLSYKQNTIDPKAAKKWTRKASRWS
ncbi:MAG: hypothetical protein COT74_08435 [Bdellovibrionales bacterium CG10_big_fil_rev_8_21_14_0_10_45_34]|nr:MAG: hypothetical protein COT74_08435 [Bdellovibrionales bacterium CG10_big_fil_rev_8_21_14_0_10_45_34]